MEHVALGQNLSDDVNVILATHDSNIGDYEFARTSGVLSGAAGTYLHLVPASPIPFIIL